MRSFRTLRRSLVLLTIAGAAMACSPMDSGRDLTGPATAPRESLLGLDLGGLTRLLLSPLRTTAISSEAVIDDDGGTVRVVDAVSGSSYELRVPAGAVNRPTIFRVVVPAGALYEADLTAMVERSDGKLVDVGSRGFDRPVTLAIKYANPLGLLSPKVFIAWIDDDGQILQALPSTTSLLTSTVQANLAHFSRYALASN